MKQLVLFVGLFIATRLHGQIVPDRLFGTGIENLRNHAMLINADSDLPASANQVIALSGFPITQTTQLRPLLANEQNASAIALGDINQDGINDLVVGNGIGVPGRIRIYDGRNLALMADFFPFPSTYSNGFSLAMGFYKTGAGAPDLYVATAAGPSLVKVFDGAALANGQVSELVAFAPYPNTLTAGVRVAALDTNGDRKEDIVVIPGPGVVSHLKVFDAAGTNAELYSFFVFDNANTSGCQLATGDFDGNGRKDLVVTSDIGGSAFFRILDGRNLLAPDLRTGNAFATDANMRLRVAAKDLNADAIAELIAANNLLQGQLRIFDFIQPNPIIFETRVYQTVAGFAGGIFVATAP